MSKIIKIMIAVMLTAAMICGIMTSCKPHTSSGDTTAADTKGHDVMDAPETKGIVTDTGTETEVDTETDTDVNTETDPGSGSDTGKDPVTTPSDSTSSDTSAETETEDTKEETTEEITTPVHSHTFSAWKTVKEAACESKGSRERVCSGCGEKETEDIPALGHKYGAWKTVKEATCKEEGKKERECERCGKKETKDIDKTDHQWGDWYEVKAPTTTENGLKERSCKICGKVEQKSIDKLSGACDYHPYPAGDWSHTTYLGKTEANCLEGERHKYKCTTCGVEFLSDYAPGGIYDGSNLAGPLGHDWSDWVVTKEPTATEDGEMQKTCKRCGKAEKNKVDKTGEAVWGYTVESWEEASGTHYGLIFSENPNEGSGYGIADYRSWGEPPTIVRSGENEVTVVWTGKNGEPLKVVMSGYNPKEHLSCTLELFDDGTYIYQYVIIGR